LIKTSILSIRGEALLQFFLFFFINDVNGFTPFILMRSFLSQLLYLIYCLFAGSCLSRRPGERASTDDVHMEMKDGLTSVRSVVDHDSVPVLGEAELLRHFASNVH